MYTTIGAAYTIHCEHTLTYSLFQLVYTFAPVNHTLMISPQFPALEMIVWPNNCFV